MFVVLSYLNGSAQELVFKSPALETALNTAGKDGAVYRFKDVTTNVDAKVKIVGRSSSLVTLTTIDIPGLITGYDNAFQPQVNFNNGSTPNGNSEWYMEFEVTLVKKSTDQGIILSKADLTALDIDGNDATLREVVTLYNMKSYTLESNTQLTGKAVSHNLSGLTGSQPGREFESPKKQYSNIIFTETRVMVSSKYENVTKFRFRVGGKSTDRRNDSDRMYCLWFKSFTYQAPVEGALPVKLSSFNANKKNDTKVSLTWTTAQEENVNHFVIERSFDGVNYTDAGIVFATGNSTITRQYSFTDDLKNNNAGVVYYRLRMIDNDGRYDHSLVRLIKNGQKSQATIQAFPNPVVNELRVSLPATWQEKMVYVDIYSNNGQLMKRTTFNKAGQTESVNMSDLNTGLYIVKVTNGTETATQRIAKAR